MANTILVGAQWGDEGKGKIIDYLTDEAHVVVRSQGGNNAGHTIICGSEKYVLHLIPSGILRKGKVCVIGNGVVVDPISLVREIEHLRDRGIEVKRNLVLSDCAHLVFPYHQLLDEQREAGRGKGKIGTTKRGIGPAYGDKAARIGIRVGDLLKPAVFTEKARARISDYNRILRAQGASQVNAAAVIRDYLKAAKTLAPFITNTVVFVHRAMAAGKNVLFEGAQGTFLDIDHGTYPFVTSSNTTAGGACTGTGVPPHRMDRVIGVMKAYTTRVGEGPLPTENDELSDVLHEMGREFGATTGRPRRCGWFDAVAAGYANMINGFDEIAITNLDGLDGVKTIRICTGYRLGGRILRVPPSDIAELERCEPVYRQMPGWLQPTDHIRKYKDLPANAKRYLEVLVKLIGAPLSIASVGASREQTIRV